jgi:hypothetical protein
MAGREPAGGLTSRCPIEFAADFNAVKFAPIAILAALTDSVASVVWASRSLAFRLAAIVTKLNTLGSRPFATDAMRRHSLEKYQLY